MTADSLKDLGSLIPYWAFMLVTAGGFYKTMVFVGGHFPDDFRKDLSLWLDGVYETSWSTHFCRMFDAVFGPRHLSLKRFIRSAIASVLSVVALYILFAHVLGVMGARTFGAMPVTQALLVGAVINIIPDYLSLIETRWLLDRFGRHQSFFAQVCLLIADLIFSAAIITGFIYAYAWFADERIPSPVELVALFSVYSVFFYSSFMSSAWAWVYCLSAWFVRLFSKVGLRKVLDVKKDPVKQIALVGAAVMVLGGTTAGPVLWPDKGGFSNSFDEFVCGLDQYACFHAARLTGDPERAARFMELACKDAKDDKPCGDHMEALFEEGDREVFSAVWERACEGGFIWSCWAAGWAYESAEGNKRDPVRAAKLFEKACDNGNLDGCNNLGVLLKTGADGVEPDLERALLLYQKACDGKEMFGCGNLGAMYEYGTGVDPDPERAVALYRQVCDSGLMFGCTYLGAMFQSGKGVDLDRGKAVELYRRACDGGDTQGCNNLGWMYQTNRGGETDLVNATILYSATCTAGNLSACVNLGWLFQNGNGLDQDPTSAARLYQAACDENEMQACNNLGTIYEDGPGVVPDINRAAALYRQACDGGNMNGCTNLGTLYNYGKGLDPDTKRAAELYQKACDGNDFAGCHNLGLLYAKGTGVELDQSRAAELFRKACDGGHFAACNQTVGSPAATKAPDAPP